MAGVPHTPGTREYLTCERGTVELAVAGERYTLAEGDVVIFRGDQRHGYHNPGKHDRGRLLRDRVRAGHVVITTGSSCRASRPELMAFRTSASLSENGFIISSHHFDHFGPRDTAGSSASVT